MPEKGKTTTTKKTKVKNITPLLGCVYDEPELTTPVKAKTPKKPAAKQTSTKASTAKTASIKPATTKATTAKTTGSKAGTAKTTGTKTASINAAAKATAVKPAAKTTPQRAQTPNRRTNNPAPRNNAPVKRQAKSTPPVKYVPQKVPKLMYFSLLIILISLGVLLWSIKDYSAFKQKKAAVSKNGFFAGVLVDGVELSGLSKEEALIALNTKAEGAYSSKSVKVTVNGTEHVFSASDMGYSSNVTEVIERAWLLGRTGSLDSRYKEIEALKKRPINLGVTRTTYDTGILYASVKKLSDSYSTGARGATVESFDPNTLTFTFSEGKAGSYLDCDLLYSQVTEAFLNGGGEIVTTPETVTPSVSAEEMQSQFGLITSAKTNASSSSNNRLTNIKLALEAINGYCLKPGETFSFNKTVGQRTKARGFKTAPVFDDGTVSEGIGGGICQVSTTLFNAAMKADLELVERNPHSLTVSYVDKGKDAAVDWPDRDLKFKNNTNENIYIMAKLTDDKRVVIGMYGRLLDTVITIEAQTVETIAAKEKYVYNPLLSKGKQVVTDKGHDGYKAIAYKVYSDMNGNELKREELCKSVYKAGTKVIEYGS